MTFEKGEQVRVRRDPTDDWCPARVALVSENGKALGLWLDGAVRGGDGFVAAALPLTVEDDGTIRSLFGDLYTVEKMSAAKSQP